MAQRTIHYLFGELFSKQIELKDKQRFLLGNVLPDAYAKGSDRDRTHFTVKTLESLHLAESTHQSQQPQPTPIQRSR